MRSKKIIRVGRTELVVSNLDKPYFPECGFTKGEVVQYYSDIADTIIPHLAQRPLTLIRFPDGVKGQHFYEKNAPAHTPEWIKRFAVERSEGGEPIRYVLCNDKATLLWATNLGDIEKHVLLARAPHLNVPTSMVFDLDPGAPAGILDCCEIAIQLKDVLEGLGLQCLVKVSGSKGLHLSVPLNGKLTYEATQPFAKTIAELMEQRMPDRVVSDMAKARRKGKILIDWSQNSDFKTTVAVYAMRAKRDEPFISLPVTWEEVAKAAKRENEAMLFFTPEQAIKRIKKLGDLFAPALKLRQNLPPAFTQALSAGPAPKLSTWQRHAGKRKDDVRDKSLREYEAKRDHTQTAEPKAKPVKHQGKDKGPRRFVIQKHQASHLHYDFRLEMQGVLRSWAVPKGPPQEPKQTRLAMHVEDHPLEYASFEGTIPAKNYGAGTVMVWDQGEYEEATGNPAAAFYAGKMHLIMKGQKLKGEWILLKDRSKDEEDNRWMLIKAGKAIKISAKADDTSVISGRTMAKIARDNDAQWHSTTPEEKHRKSPPSSHRVVEPEWVEPMMCKPVPELPTDENWTFEIKFDGYRTLAIKTAGKTALYSRNHKSFTSRFPKVAEALHSLSAEFTLDGEIVALDENGRPSFQLLQNNASKSLEVSFYCFDLLNLDGEDLQSQPVERRRQLLDELLASANEPVRLSPLLKGSADEVMNAVAKLNLEGVVAKRKGSSYESGERSGAWVKHRTNRQQEFVIGGYIPGSRGFDDLLVGVYEKKKLNFVAQVRNGIVPRVRDAVFDRIKRLTTSTCPFANLPETKAARWGQAMTAEKMKDCVWLKPKEVCQVAFVEWTDGGKLRHCKFLGMRDDKKASQVERES